VIAEAGRGVRESFRRYDFFAGTFAPFLRASESPIAIACFRLLTRPPFPALPERNVPCFFRRIALLTDFPAAFPYLGIVASLAEQPIIQQRYRDDAGATMGDCL
jgi:hypothetical protein